MGVISRGYKEVLLWNEYCISEYHSQKLCSTEFIHNYDAGTLHQYRTPSEHIPFMFIIHFTSLCHVLNVGWCAEYVHKAPHPIVYIHNAYNCDIHVYNSHHPLITLTTQLFRIKISAATHPSPHMCFETLHCDYVSITTNIFYIIFFINDIVEYMYYLFIQ